LIHVSAAHKHTVHARSVQLRHLRSGNYIAAINELRETMETPEFQAARHFVEAELAAKLEDPAFRRALVDRSARTEQNRLLVQQFTTIGNFFEAMGMLMKAGVVDVDVATEMWGGIISGAWDSMEPAIAMIRRAFGPSVWDNFEYATVLSQDWNNAHPDGAYPAHMRRLQVRDPWADATRELGSQ